MKFPKLALITFAICFIASHCYATTEVFVMAKDGTVWIVSDTLEQNLDYGQVTSNSTTCKLVVQRGRIIFNAGYFTDTQLLHAALAPLPLTDFESTVRNIEPILRKYSWNPPGVPIDRFLIGHSIGLVQVTRGSYSGGLIELSTNLHTFFTRPVLLPFIPGIPHCFGDVVDTVNHATKTDPALIKRISENPKTELLKILVDEKRLHPDAVGGPYTILLLHKDGTVSDFSQKHVCEIPREALHRTGSR